LPERGQVQVEVRDLRLQRRGEPRRSRHVADRLRSDGVDRSRRGRDRRAREESGELRTELATGSRPRRDGLSGPAWLLVRPSGRQTQVQTWSYPSFPARRAAPQVSTVEGRNGSVVTLVHPIGGTR